MHSKNLSTQHVVEGASKYCQHVLYL